MDPNVTRALANLFHMDLSNCSSSADDCLGLNHSWLNDSLAGNSHLFRCPSTDMPLSNLVFMLLYAVVGIVGLMGNTLVIYVVLRFSNMQTVTNMYILNLAIADECFLIGIPFLIATMNIRHWPFGSGMCKAYMVSTSITQFASSIFLLVLSADRYIAICHHVSSPKYRTPFVSRIVSGIAWAASSLIMLPIMLYATAIPQKKDHFTCGILWPVDEETDEENEYSGFSFTLYSLVLGFAIPLCFIMTFYCLVIRKLRKVSRKTASKSQNKRRSHRKVTKLVLTVITVYILCWLPYWISQVALISSSPDSCNTRLNITIFLFVGCLGYSNSAINPILYAYLSDNFKKSFMKACVCTGVREVNAQLKLENSVLPRKSRSRTNFDSQQISLATRSDAKIAIDLTTATTTTTGTTMLYSSSQHPSPTAYHKPVPSLGDDSSKNKFSNNDKNHSSTNIIQNGGGKWNGGTDETNPQAIVQAINRPVPTLREGELLQTI